MTFTTYKWHLAVLRPMHTCARFDSSCITIGVRKA
uniref:Uncharacterized protein n=1 Tax=Arundo donax TaxID=35708 RepID=A0A0A9H6I4_ARUDO